MFSEQIKLKAWFQADNAVKNNKQLHIFHVVLK